MRKALKITAAVLLMAAILMIVAPRIWVKNKKARLVYNGHTREDFLLYHGRGGGVLLLANLPGEAPAFLYEPGRGVASCGPGAFLNLKLVRLEARSDSRCTWFARAKDVQREGYGLKFVSPHGAAVVLEWQSPPR